jgi:signal transduction histidine kinase
MRETFRADIVYVALLDRSEGMIRFPYAYGDDLPTMALGEGLTSRIILTREPLLINEDVTGSYKQLGLQQVGTGAASYLGVPVLVGEEAIGVISVQSTTEQGRFGADDLRLLSTIAANVGVALQNAEAYRHLGEALDELKAAQQQLVHQEKLASLGALTAGIAHEIKNPLNFVNNFASLNGELVDELLQALSEDSPDTEALLADLRLNNAKIEEHGRRADGIVRSMLEHSRGSTGERRSVDLNALVEEYVGLAYHGKRAQMMDFNAAIVRDYDDAVGDVEIVPQEIGRVLINLLGNAFDASQEYAERVSGTNGEYSPTVRVKTRRNGSSVKIQIEDNGSGVPADLRERIFEPFFTTKPSGSGTGLGLSMSFDIVTQGHGGTLTVENADPHGANFVITLPAA